MSAAKHSPGPWHWSDRSLRCPNSQNVSIILDDDGGMVYRDSPIEAFSAELDANRHLIAAAPELLESAKQALHYMRLHKYADQAWADDLEAAIAKAEGRA